MKLPLAYYGEAVLRKKAAPVSTWDDSLHQLVRDMVETMEVEKGCGLAAPQVHRSVAVFITQIPREDEAGNVIAGELRVFINPTVVSYSREEWACEEGCLSIPGLRRRVSRPLKVVMRATDLSGQQFEEEFVGFDAHVVLHENDHLNGVLYIDRLESKERKALEPYLRKLKQRLGH